MHSVGSPRYYALISDFFSIWICEEVMARGSTGPVLNFWRLNSQAMALASTPPPSPLQSRLRISVHSKLNKEDILGSCDEMDVKSNLFIG